MTMLRSISPAMSEISVGSPSPPPGNSFQCVTIKRLKPTVDLHSAETIKFPPPLTLPQRRRSSAERVKSFSIADILGKKDRQEEKSHLNSPKPLPPAPQPPSIPIAAPVLPPHLIPERLQPGLAVPAPLLMLDLPNLHKVIPPGWDASGNPITVAAQSSNHTAAGPALPLHHFFPPALLHYEQRLAWDYQRQLQEHFQTQAQLLRQMSLDPNIIPSEDGSERSRSSSAGSRCYSPDVNVAGDDDEDGDEEEDGKAGYKCALTPGEKVGAKREENAAESKTKKSASDTPLDALFQLSTKNFDEDQDPAALNIFATRPNPKKKRKSRTAFTNHQIFELEKRFLYQKYLSPADRDEIAACLGLSNAQVITWFQNRRAKLKRDMEELKKDVESVKQLSAHKSFLENVNDLSILKTRPVSRHQPPPPPPAPAGAIQHNAEVLTAAHTHGHHITAVYNSSSSSSSNSSISTTITDRRLYTERNITGHMSSRHHQQQQQQQQLQSQPHHATTIATIAGSMCNERRDDSASETSSESLQPQQNPAAAAAAAAELQQQQPRNLQINHSRG